MKNEQQIIKFNISELDNFDNIIPQKFLDEDIIEKYGEQIVLNWFLIKKFEGKNSTIEDDTENGIRYQEIASFNISEFTKKLNSNFFKESTNYFHFYLDKNIRYFLVFKINPVNKPKQKSRLSWWDSNYVVLNYENGYWKNEKDKTHFNLFNGEILMHGNLLIDNL